MALIFSSSPHHQAALRIQLLGSVRLVAGSPGASPRAIGQPRRLALLALLADAGDAGISRDRVLGMLWPDVPESRARHSLDQLLYALRGDLGPDAVISGAGLSLSRALLSCDVWDFEAAVRRADWTTATTLYSGPFLDGFFAGGSEDFEHWADARRAALAAQWRQALESLALQSDDAADHPAAVRHWTMLATNDPLSSRYALGLMKALAAAGDSVGALRHASVHAALVAEELGAPPDNSVSEYADELRAGRGTVRAAVPNAGPPATGERGPIQAPLLIVRNESKAFQLAGVAALLAVIMIAAGWLWVRQNSAAAHGPTVRSLAVLPFADFSGSNQPYLGDALTDELINHLGRVPGIDVVGRTSAFAFKGRNAALDEIGRELGVAHVLEGSVQHANGRLRVTARLVAARTGYQVWTESYDVPATDIFDVQTRIARSIAGVLKLTLASGGVALPTRNLDAYDLYLRGRTLYLNAAVNDEESTTRALDHLTTAAALDPRFAAAHAGLADVYSRLGDVKRARTAAVEALRLDSTLAEAHASLAYILAYYERDWRGAAREIDHAIRLSPGYAPAYLRRSNMRAARGEFDAALADVERALHFDPLSQAARMNEALILFWAGRYAQALQRFQDLLAVDSSRSDVRWALGLTYVGLGRISEAQAEFRQKGDTIMATIVGADRTQLESLRRTLESQGTVAEAGPKPVRPLALAAVYARLGMQERAIDVLDRILAPPASANVVFLIWFPTFRPLHAHPGFERIRRSVFPQ